MHTCVHAYICGFVCLHTRVLACMSMHYALLLTSVQRNLLQEDNHRLDVCVEEQKKEIDRLFGQNEVLNRKLQHIQSILH